MMKSRKKRKLEAKQNGVNFVPQYNGNGVITAEDFYGTGVERFNNKFVKFDKKDEILNNPSQVEVKSCKRGKVDTSIYIADKHKVELELLKLEKEIHEQKQSKDDSVIETPKSKKSKLKNKLKKLFNK